MMAVARVLWNQRAIALTPLWYAGAASWLAGGRVARHAVGTDFVYILDTSRSRAYRSARRVDNSRMLYGFFLPAKRSEFDRQGL